LPEVISEPSTNTTPEYTPRKAAAAAFDLTARARPSYEECQRDPTFDPLCGAGSTASFWSGHTAQAFTAAGLSCAHHAYVKLYGGGAADTLACAGAITLGAATGSLRVIGDRHYVSDVFVGALVGFGFGYGMPTLLHYAGGPERRLGLSLVPTDSGLALGASGAF
jgi:membrane-associated phospholipid phosphatase